MRSIGFAVSSCFAIVTAPGFAADSAPGCPALATPPAAACQANARGLAYADSRDGAVLAADALATAAADFEALFDRPAPRGLLVLSSTFGGDAARALARGQDLGYALSWLPAQAKREMAEATMLRSGIDAATAAPMLDQLVAQHDTTLRHELGHKLYSAVYWPGVDDAPGQRYGSPAPDWLDEGVAILMEGGAPRQRHLDSFLAGAQAAPDHAQPLAAFLEAPHPMLQARGAALLRDAQASASGVRVMRAADGHAAALGRYYGQSLVFATFLREASGDPRILGTISAALAGGADFAGWLVDAGVRHGLPGSVEALQAAWDAWIAGQPVAGG